MSQEPPAKQGERVPHPQLHHDLDLLRFGAHRQGHFERPTFGIVPPTFFPPAQISPAVVSASRSRYVQPPLKRSRYSHPGYPFAPGPQMSLPNMPLPDVFGNIGRDGKISNSQHTQKAFDATRQDSPQLEERPMWPNYPPGVPLPSPQMYSRLPPNETGSKQEYREKHKPDSRGQVQQDSRNDTPALDQEAPGKQRQIRHGGHQGLPRAPVRSRPLVLEDDDEVDGGDEHVPMASIEVDPVSDEELPLASPTPARSRRGQLGANRVSQRPRPRYQYKVPKGLKGVQLALGEDNWNEYVMLVEKRLLGEITEMELIKESRAIFLVFNGDMGGRIEELVANKMVMPVIMEQAVER